MMISLRVCGFHSIVQLFYINTNRFFRGAQLIIIYESVIKDLHIKFCYRNNSEVLHVSTSDDNIIP